MQLKAEKTKLFAVLIVWVCNRLWLGLITGRKCGEYGRVRGRWRRGSAGYGGEDGSRNGGDARKVTVVTAVNMEVMCGRCRSLRRICVRMTIHVA